MIVASVFVHFNTKVTKFSSWFVTGVSYLPVCSNIRWRRTEPDRKQSSSWQNESSLLVQCKPANFWWTARRTFRCRNWVSDFTFWNWIFVTLCAQMRRSTSSRVQMAMIVRPWNKLRKLNEIFNLLLHKCSVIRVKKSRHLIYRGITHLWKWI